MLGKVDGKLVSGNEIKLKEDDFYERACIRSEPHYIKLW